MPAINTFATSVLVSSNLQIPCAPISLNEIAAPFLLVDADEEPETEGGGDDNCQARVSDDDRTNDDNHESNRNEDCPVNENNELEAPRIELNSSVSAGQSQACSMYGLALS